MSKLFNSRTFVSIGLFCFFLIMLVTSVLMFINRHTTLVSMTHTLLGTVLLLFVVWHLKNNIASLKQHIKFRNRSAPNLAMLAAILFGATLLVLSLNQFRPFLAFYAWGNQLRAGDTSAQQGEFTYLRVNQAEENASGLTLKIDLRTGPAFAWPQYAIWLETLEGEFIQALYVTRKLAEDSFTTKAIKKDSNIVFTSDLSESGDLDNEQLFEFKDNPQMEGKRERPESLPVFLHKLQGHLLNNKESKHLALDGYTGATLSNSFLLSSKTRKPINSAFKVRLEINQSFDFNEYYSSNRFPDDPIYSGDGFSAQPSVIYEAVIDPTNTQIYYPMTLVGHGHHSGKDGVLYTDLKNLTTALQILDRVIIELGKSSPNSY